MMTYPIDMNHLLETIVHGYLSKLMSRATIIALSIHVNSELNIEPLINTTSKYTKVLSRSSQLIN